MIQMITNYPIAVRLAGTHGVVRNPAPSAKCTASFSCPLMKGTTRRHPPSAVAATDVAKRRTVRAMAANGADPPSPPPAAGPVSFLSLEEAGLVEMSGLEMHEKFLARLTISSLNLLRVISEQENIPIEDLNSGRICDWFIKDKEKREKDINTATLKWDHGPGW